MLNYVFKILLVRVGGEGDEEKVTAERRVSTSTAK